MKVKAKTKRKWVVLVLKVLAFAVNIAFPAWAVLDKFPMWKQEGGLFASLGVGAMILGVIIAWTLRNALAAWIKEHLGQFAWSQSVFWIGGTVILLLLNTMSGIVADLLTVWIAGTCGMLVGTVILYIAQKVSDIEPKGALSDGTNDGT